MGIARYCAALSLRSRGLQLVRGNPTVEGAIGMHVCMYIADKKRRYKECGAPQVIAKMGESVEKAREMELESAFIIINKFTAFLHHKAQQALPRQFTWDRKMPFKVYRPMKQCFMLVRGWAKSPYAS